MAVVMIGIDPHKASHTATAIDATEKVLAKIRVKANTDQLNRLLEWAAVWPERTWAVENATGLGHLLAQQLLRAGEQVLDVPPKLAAKARLPSDGNTNKNDPNDARSVAVVGLRSAKVRPAVAEDYSAAMGMWSDRYLELAAARTQVVCRLHALLCELVPGGFPGVLRAAAAQRMLEEIAPDTPADHARLALAWQLLSDLVRIDEQRRQTKKHISLAVAASETTLTEVYGVGAFVACAVKGLVGTSIASPAEPPSPRTTAPPPSRCPRETRRSTGCPGEATDDSTTPSTWPPSPRSASRAHRSTTNANELRAKEPKKPSGHSNAGSATSSTPASSPTPKPPPPGAAVREGNRGTTLNPARPDRTPTSRLFGTATPGPAPTLRPARPRRRERNSPEPLDTNRYSFRSAAARLGPIFGVSVRHLLRNRIGGPRLTTTGPLIG